MDRGREEVVARDRGINLGDPAPDVIIAPIATDLSPAKDVDHLGIDRSHCRLGAATEVDGCWVIAPVVGLDKDRAAGVAPRSW